MQQVATKFNWYTGHQGEHHRNYTHCFVVAERQATCLQHLIYYVYN